MVSAARKKWEKTVESLFKTLITPIGIVFAVTWSFLFFYGGEIGSPTYVVETGLSILARDFTLLASSILSWVLGNFTSGKKSMALKILSINALTFTFLSAPSSIFVSYLTVIAHLRGDYASNLYFITIVILQIIIFFLSLPPSIRSKCL